ncbi:MAG: Maf family protein [Acidobacteriota bacterium]
MPPQKHTIDSFPALVLASASPRRREILQGLGLPFTVRPADIDETPREDEAPLAYVERLAQAKARSVARPGEVVLAADTTVILAGEILGKPADESDARSMLQRLSGRSHQVATGIALHRSPPAGSSADAGDPSSTSSGESHGEVETREVETGEVEICGVEVSEVHFASLTPREIDWYVASGEPMDKAGAYGIQGLAALFIDRLEGSYSNVVGLPVATFYRLGKSLGVDWLELASAPPGGS